MEKIDYKENARKAAESRKRNAEARRAAAQRKKEIKTALENVLLDSNSSQSERENALYLLAAEYGKRAV